MTTQTEALKLALEALEDRVSLMKWQIARDAVKEALAQPEQEPVEWYSVEGETRRYGVGMVECAYAIGRDEVVHVVTHESVKDIAMKHLPTQRTWVGLAEDEAFACQGRNYFETYKAIEAKLKEKNS